MESLTNFFKFYSIAVVVLKLSLIPELSCAVGNEKEYIMKERDYKNYFPTEKSELSESHLNIRHKRELTITTLVRWLLFNPLRL